MFKFKDNFSDYKKSVQEYVNETDFEKELNKINMIPSEWNDDDINIRKVSLEINSTSNDYNDDVAWNKLNLNVSNNSNIKTNELSASLTNSKKILRAA